MNQNSSRHGRVGRDREDVPHERASELRPDAHRVRIRQQPVVEPRTAGVNQREDAGARDREQRHRFGEAVDRRPPRLLQEQQDRGDQRAGVADADPPDEVRDLERPADRDVVAPDPDALDDQVATDTNSTIVSRNDDAEAASTSRSRLARQDDRR